MSTLASQTGMLLPATSKLVDRMIDAALIQRSVDPDDNRRVVLHISDFGLAKFAEIQGGLAKRREQVQAALTPAAESRLRELLADFIRIQQSTR
jgi:DNA-binding MarR family transcriptional regulator